MCCRLPRDASRPPRREAGALRPRGTAARVAAIARCLTTTATATTAIPTTNCFAMTRFPAAVDPPSHGRAATAATHADADVAEDGFGPLQLLQRALLRRECGLRVAAGELLFRRVHDRRRLIQNLGDLGEVAVARRDTAVDDAPREFLGLPAQLLLRHAERR